MARSRYDGSRIEVINWSLYNPRTDSKKPSWFRFENSIATSPTFFDLDCEQKWLWVIILSLVSQSNGQPIAWNSQYIRNISGIDPDKQDQTIDIFIEFTRLRVSRKVTLRDSPATYERTNVRTTLVDFDKSTNNCLLESGKDKAGSKNSPKRKNSRVSYAPDFDALYAQYPRQEGKQNGYKIYSSEISSAEEKEILLQAIKNYSALCKKENREKKHIKHFGTFMNCWRDYIQPPDLKLQDQVQPTPMMTEQERQEHRRKIIEQYKLAQQQPGESANGTDISKSLTRD